VLCAGTLRHLPLEGEHAAIARGQMPPIMHQLPNVGGHFGAVLPMRQFLSVYESRLCLMVGQVEPYTSTLCKHHRLGSLIVIGTDESGNDGNSRLRPISREQTGSGCTLGICSACLGPLVLEP
jgi:hypothetical protein